MAKVPETTARTLHCDHCGIRHKSICGALSADEMHHLNEIATVRHFSAGETIFSDEEQSAYFANILSGVVKLTKILPDGRQQMVGLHFSPDFLGRAYGQVNPYFAEAATDVELCCFQQSAFENLLQKHSGLERRLLENTLSELDTAREWMLLLGRKTAIEKLASFLLLLVKRAPLIGCTHVSIHDLTEIDLPLSRSDIADFLGLTIETVSRQFGKLKSEGAIELIDSRRCKVLDMALLSECAGQEPPPLD